MPKATVKSLIESTTSAGNRKATSTNTSVTTTTLEPATAIANIMTSTTSGVNRDIFTTPDSSNKSNIDYENIKANILEASTSIIEESSICPQGFYSINGLCVGQ
uniref:Uncharacterized protein n=1 Tax=Heterorhabditis bacteriophora TaxID=37862 RepID=A0A1I7X0C8_HETBA